MERGTLFVTASGDVVPCPELAYTHAAIYFRFPRMHYRFTLGNIKERSLMDIWHEKETELFRGKFVAFDFPDCLHICDDPDRCYHRDQPHGDCFWNGTPCGECLWARGIIVCP